MTRMSIKVLRGVNLVGKDRHLMSENTSDPYCKIYINDHQIARTPVLYQTLDPIWGGPMSTFEFEGDPKTTEIRVEIYDFNELMSDKRMGQVTFVASDVIGKCSKKYPNVWLPVQSLGGCRCSGELEVHLLSLPPKKSPQKDRSNKGATRSTAADIPTITEDGPAKNNNELRESAISNLSAGPKLKQVGMCHNKASLRDRILESRCPVTLHVYDVSNDDRIAKFNRVAKPCPGLNGGIFHAAVEVYGREYSFGGSRNNTTGIFACRPRKCPMHHYRESLFLGDCDLTAQQVSQILRKMKPEWMAPTYDLFRKNCCFFSKEFAIELGVGHIPEWVYSLANTGAAIDDYRIKREKARKEAERKAAIKEQERQKQAAIAAAAAEAEKSKKKAPRITVGTNTPSVGSSIIGECIEITHSSEGGDSPMITIGKNTSVGSSVIGESIEITQSFGEGGGRSVEIHPSSKKEETEEEDESRDAPNSALPAISEKKSADYVRSESCEVASFVTGIETGVLDNVMAARVQRMYRESVAVKKRRASMIPAEHAANQRQE